jgi:ssDNA-binding Zn-finger/Zn-ribbon topoisomerase 1
MPIENVKCPLCEGPMVSRANRATGQRFWGCKKYPDCRGTRNTDGEARALWEAEDPEGADLSPSERASRNDHARWRNQ